VKTVFLCSILFLLSSGGVRAQTDSAPVDSSGMDSGALYTAIAAEAGYYALSMTVLQNTWYRGRAVVPFHFYNDNRAYLQVDKCGHAFGAYVESYAGYALLRGAGLSRTNALVFGGSLGLIMQTPIEIMDGIHEGWGFSWGDMLANTLGSGIVVGQELLFDEQVIKCKFSYWESRYSRQANGYLGKTSLDRVLKDYNGQTYWLSLPLDRILPRSGLPPWLCVSFGYGANGMYGEYRNIEEYEGVRIPPATRYRQFLLSFDIDWTRIETDSPILRTILTGLTFLKLPSPALELNSLGKTEGYWLYY